MVVYTRDPKIPQGNTAGKQYFQQCRWKQNQLTKINSSHIQMAKWIEKKKIWETTPFIVTSNPNTIKYT